MKRLLSLLPLLFACTGGSDNSGNADAGLQSACAGNEDYWIVPGVVLTSANEVFDLTIWSGSPGHHYLDRENSLQILMGSDAPLENARLIVQAEGAPSTDAVVAQDQGAVLQPGAYQFEGIRYSAAGPTRLRFTLESPASDTLLWDICVSQSPDE